MVDKFKFDIFAPLFIFGTHFFSEISDGIGENSFSEIIVNISPCSSLGLNEIS